MKRMKELSKEALLEQYAEAAQGYMDEIRGGAARAANRHHSAAERVFEELKRRGAERGLLALLSHPRPAVRLWAAVHAWNIEPDAAQKTLEFLVENMTGSIRTCARVALEEKGALGTALGSMRPTPRTEMPYE